MPTRTRTANSSPSATPSTSLRERHNPTQPTLSSPPSVTTQDPDQPTTDREPSGFAELTQAVLAEQTARESAAAQADATEIRPDEELPGVGDEPLSFREGVAAGGVGVIAVLGTLDATDALQIAIPRLLGPEIQASLGVSDAGLAVVSIGGLISSTLFAVPMGRLADRIDRMKLVGWATLFWSLAMFARGFQATALGFFLIGLVMGIGTSNTFPVQGAVLADAYPIQTRGRIYAVKNVLGRAGERIAPLLVGALMLLVDNNWRWAYWVFAWPIVALGIWALFVPDPPRGKYEQLATIGEVMEEDPDQPKVSVSAVWHRLMAIRTLKLAWISFSIIVFSIIGQSFLVNLYLEDRWGLSPFARAMIGFVPGMLAFAAAPWAASRYDDLYQQSPAKALAWVGALFFPMAAAIPIQFYMPHPVLFAIVGIIPSVLAVVVFGMISPLLVGVVPYRLRAQATALSIMVIFLGGGVLGPIVAGLLSDATSERTAILIVAIPFKILGGILLIWGARHIRHDLSLVVDEIEKDKAELDWRTAHPDDIPAVSLRDIDFSYGPVQVLFGVDLRIEPGETLALLGTNGAGKSTILRVISGLAVPSRGIVELGGRDITLTSPQTRVGLGIAQLPGGNAVFGPMSIHDNLRTAGWSLRKDGTVLADRIAEVLKTFPMLAERLDEPANELSGGQQQMLALAMVLIHKPEILLIDELSLGLAPTVVADLLEVVEQLREQGQTMIIVEQSLNVAAAIADRAVFIEKGHVRFDGPIRELAARGDIARAVFLGTARDSTSDSDDETPDPDQNPDTP
ncbi:MAG: MFS transporter [Acidimicrobiaceae bacterium]|nr:MFS transporter [Acidimicrobiaceae bacterium]MYG55495.1 MFS transporter [Acidimicrobiaceae bacterium]MYJ99286.1 MFS transporter [Acidimicrobiaceae bacterium]